MRGGPQYWEKTLSHCHFIVHNHTWTVSGSNTGFAVKGPWVTAWTIARPSKMKFMLNNTKVQFLSYMKIRFVSLTKTDLLNAGLGNVWSRCLFWNPHVHCVGKIWNYVNGKAGGTFSYRCDFFCLNWDVAVRSVRTVAYNREGGSWTDCRFLENCQDRSLWHGSYLVEWMVVKSLPDRDLHKSNASERERSHVTVTGRWIQQLAKLRTVTWTVVQ